MDWAQYYEIFGRIEWLLWLVTSLAILTIRILKLANQSFYCVALVYMVSEPLMLGLEAVYQFYWDTTEPQVMRLIWYWTWAIIYAANLTAIYIYHRNQKIYLGRLGMNVAFAYSAAVFLQLTRYNDRLSSDVLGTIYTFGVQSINIAVASMLCAPLLWYALIKIEKRATGLNY